MLPSKIKNKLKYEIDERIVINGLKLRRKQNLFLITKLVISLERITHLK